MTPPPPTPPTPPTPTSLAMFPLGTVLVPFAILPLHVFEPRYRVLMFDCLRGDQEFGVVLIERGHEVGGEDQRFAVATVALIADARELPDGRWVLLAAGTRRVDIVEWLPDDPYPMALTRARPESPWSDAADAALAVAEAAVRRLLAQAAELDQEEAPASLDLAAEPEVAAWQLVSDTPMSPLDKQRLLAVDDPAERLRQLTAVAEDQGILLAYRLNRE
jgi:Lon protease-like protein